jgi:glycerol-3-phosphate dehydrogenase (NAD(P)+)
MKLVILGEGRWGKTIGTLATMNGHEVIFTHHLDSRWPGGEDALLIALPVQFLRATLTRFPCPAVPILSLSKGLEIETGQRVSQIIRSVWTESTVATLSGPNLAVEIGRGLPAAAVVAAETEAQAEFFQSLLHQSAFRLYRSTDLIGVELGGALKNIYAIAGGVCAGLNLGENAFAALLTRCLAEMTRIGLIAGGRPETFAGLSGIGDLFLTAHSEQSRNHRVGRLLAQDWKLADILADSPGVAEGVATTQSVVQDARIPGEDKPIAAQIHAVLFENKSPRQAVQDLMTRAPVPE